MRIALTHSLGRLEGLAEALRRRGHQVEHVPLVVTRPRHGEGVRDAARALLELPWLLFTSRSAVEAWAGLEVGWGAPDEGAAARVGAVGRKTATALRRAGAEPALVAERSARAAGLADAFLEHPAAAGPVGLPQGDRALPTLRRALEGAGFETRPLVLYETVTQPWPSDAGEGAAVDDGAGPELVVVASPSAVQALPASVETARLVALGPTTAAALEGRGLRCRVAETPGVGGVLAVIEAATEEATMEAAEAPQAFEAKEAAAASEAPTEAGSARHEGGRG